MLGWLALYAFGVDFKEIELELFSDEFKQTLARYNANDKVPLLIDEEAQIYCDNLLNHPSMMEWKQQELLETSVVEEDEFGE